MHRTVHPYEDVDVIDARAPRFNQAVVALMSGIAALTGAWILVAVMALQLIIGLRFGRQYCLPCVFYFEVVQPRIGEGEIEDARPPRFANIIGALFLSASTIAFVIGLTTVGTLLAAVVAALAGLAVVTGLCVGCEMYKLIARFRGIRPGHVDRIDLEELGAGQGAGLVVHFTHPLCTDCRDVQERLSAEGHQVFPVDVRERSDIARKYHVSVVPQSFSVGADGEVLARLA